MIVFAIGAAVFGMLLMSSNSNKSHQSRNDQGSINSAALSDLSRENANNLKNIDQERIKVHKIFEAQAKEEQAHLHPVMQQAPVISPEQQQEKQKIAQELKMRMNAPMGVLSGQSHSRSTTRNSVKSVSVSGLAGGNGAKFANSQLTYVQAVKAKRVPHPNYSIVQGEMMHAVLTTAISNELAGMINATVTRDVYSYNDERILLPKGSRLVGQFRSGGGNAASSRVFIIWNRVITPDGISVMINSGSSDTLGRSGQGADYVDTHFFKMFGTAAMISLIGASASVGDNTTGMYPTTEQQYRQAITQSFGQTANQVLAHNINLEPTLYVEQGASINVFIAHDLDFYGVLKGH